MEVIQSTALHDFMETTRSKKSSGGLVLPPGILKLNSMSKIAGMKIAAKLAPDVKTNIYYWEYYSDFVVYSTGTSEEEMINLLLVRQTLNE